MAIAPKLWNQLPLAIRQSNSVDNFKRALNTYLFCESSFFYSSCKKHQDIYNYVKCVFIIITVQAKLTFLVQTLYFCTNVIFLSGIRVKVHNQCILIH